jgi:hypothetical protein
MIKLALFARLEAKPGKEAAVTKFLETGLALANQEATTPIWFALKLSQTPSACSTRSMMKTAGRPILPDRSLRR